MSLIMLEENSPYTFTWAKNKTTKINYLYLFSPSFVFVQLQRIGYWANIHLVVRARCYLCSTIPLTWYDGEELESTFWGWDSNGIRNETKSNNVSELLELLDAAVEESTQVRNAMKIEFFKVGLPTQSVQEQFKLWGHKGRYFLFLGKYSEKESWAKNVCGDQLVTEWCPTPPCQAPSHLPCHNQRHYCEKKKFPPATEKGSRKPRQWHPLKDFSKRFFARH